MKYLIVLSLSLCMALAENEAVLQEFVDANNLFTSSLYKEILKKSYQNFLFSPYSVETVLAFTQSGCKGETAQEIRKSLYLPDDNDKIKSAVKQSISLLKGNDQYSLHSANKMYLKDGLPITEEFKNTATEIYQAGIENINFEENEKAAKIMNEWVEQQTNNKIKNLIHPNGLDQLTAAILINALYFKGKWAEPFSNFTTSRNDFYQAKNEVIEVDTMYHYEEWFYYYESSELNAKFLEMPFEGGDVSMVIALPNEKEGLSSLENQIEKVFQVQNFTSTLVNIALPKFKIESTLPLTKIMQNLGIKKAFDFKQADLSGIAGKKGDIAVSEILQKTYINVEEGGVEAASATYLKAVLESAVIDPIRAKDFIADHPFIFYIKAKGIVIFAGRVNNPLK